jgi:nitric oxide reductase large subunit
LFTKFKNWLNNNSPTLASIGSILLIFSLFGFNFNIFEYSNYFFSLDIKNQMYTLFSLNVAISIFIGAVVFSRLKTIPKINKKNKK